MTDTEIGRRERVAVAEGAHRDVLDRPRADPGHVEQSRASLGALRSTGAARRDLIALTAACDAVDVGTALLGRRAGFSWVTTALGGGTAVAAGVVAAAAAHDAERA